MDLTGVEGAGSAAGSPATDEVAGGTEEGRRMSALGAMTEAIPNVLKTAQILDLVMPPVGKNRARVLLTPAGAAAIVHRQHCVAVSRKHLPLDTERMLILTVRSTVDAQQQRDFRSFRVTNRISQQAMYVGAVFALEIHFFSLRNLKLVHQGLVLMS